MKKDANPGKVITELCFQFVSWTTGKVEKFPRVHKFTIGDRIHTLSIDLMLRAVEATYTRDRIPILRQPVKRANGG